MNYTASPTNGRQRTELLHALGAAVRKRRRRARAHAEGARPQRAGVSERFLAQLETGEGNISVARLEDVAEALGTDARLRCWTRASRLRPRRARSWPCSACGARARARSGRVARRLGVPFFELDALVAREAGMPLPTIFEMHGEA